MNDYSNERRGVLFKNIKREGKQDPDYRGSATLAGVEYWMSAWVNTARSGPKSGEKYMALNFQPKEAPAVSVAKDTPSAPPVAELDDDIPF